MNRMILTALIAILTLGAQAQTASKLMKKYRSMPGARYEQINLDSMRSDPFQTADMLEKMKGLKQIEVVAVELTKEEREKLTKDAGRLKGFNLMYNAANRLPADEDIAEGNKLRQQLERLNQMLADVAVAIYARGETVSKETLILVDLFAATAIARIEGEIRTEDIPAFLDIDASLKDDRESSPMLDSPMSAGEAMEKAKESCAIAIGGKYRPDLKNMVEATAWLKANNLDAASIGLLIGRNSVKEKYPDVEAELMIEYDDLRSVYRGE